MTRVFVLHAPEEAHCAEQIRQDLEAKGYITWRQADSLQLSDLLYPGTIEVELLGSAAVILVWSSNAAQSEWVERQLLFAQRVKKPIIPVLLDKTALPATLVVGASISAQTSCAYVVAQLLQHSLFPARNSADPVILLAEQATQRSISEREAAIEKAAALLLRNEQRASVLAILDYLAHDDPRLGVRDKAEEVIAADMSRHTPQSGKPPFAAADVSHVFGVPCKNGHVTYFDKRHVCSAAKSITHRGVGSAEEELDELDLECKTCHEPLHVCIDCRGYA